MIMRLRNASRLVGSIKAPISRSIFTSKPISLLPVSQGGASSLWRRHKVSMSESESQHHDEVKDMGTSRSGIFNSLFDFVKQDLQKSSIFSKNEGNHDAEVDSDFENDETLYLKKSKSKNDSEEKAVKFGVKGDDKEKVEVKEDIGEKMNTKDDKTKKRKWNYGKKEKVNMKDDPQTTNESNQNINSKDGETTINKSKNTMMDDILDSIKNISSISGDINKRHFEPRIFSEDNLKGDIPGTNQKSKPQSTQSTTSSVDVYRGVGSYWDRFYSILRSSPIIDKFVKAKQEFDETEIGEQLTDITENIRQKWETSQHPLVYRFSYYYHKLFSLSERDQCIKIARVTDPYFNIPEFKIELEEKTYPAFVRAFLGSDSETLKKVCSPECYDQLDAFIRLRKADGLSAKNNVYQVSNVTFLKSFRLNGSPVFIYSGIVMQDNCIYDKNQNVVGGGETEVSEMVYIMAVQQILNEETHKMTWKIIELSFQELNF